MQPKFDSQFNLIEDLFLKKLKTEVVEKAWDTSLSSAIFDYLSNHANDHSYRLRYMLALAYILGYGHLNDQEKGLSLLREGVFIDHEESMFALGIIYMRGIGVKKNVKEGKILINQAAQKNYAEAQYYMGLISIEKHEDYDCAAMWLEKASENGHAEASYRLGKMNECEEFEEAEISDASVFYEKAVLQGHTIALEALLRYINEN